VVAEAAVLGVDLVALGCWFGHFGIVLCLLIVEVLVCHCDYDCCLVEVRRVGVGAVVLVSGLVFRGTCLDGMTFAQGRRLLLTRYKP
jgi:hypothetical protein